MPSSCDAVFVDAVAAYTHTDNRTSRGLSFGDLSRTAIGSFGGDVSTAIRLGTRTRIGALYAEPSVGLDWDRLSRDGFAEQNAGSAGLLSRSEVHDIVQPSVGLRVGSDFLQDGILVRTATVRVVGQSRRRPTALDRRAQNCDGQACVDRPTGRAADWQA